MLLFNRENSGLTFSSPMAIYNLTIQKMACFRTIDSSFSVSYLKKNIHNENRCDFSYLHTSVKEIKSSYVYNKYKYV